MDTKTFFENFETIANAPGGIARLRELILDLAVRGKLSQMHSADIPISTLISDLQNELAPYGEMSEIRFDIPDHWSWIPLASVVHHQLGKMLNTSKMKGLERPYLRSVNVRQDGNIDLTDVKRMLIPESELAKYDVRIGDIFVNEGGDVGRNAIWLTESDQEFAFQNQLHRLRPVCGVESRYVQIVLRHAKSSGVIAAMSSGVTIQHFSASALRKLAFPLPPVEEQKRIVAKVDELMALCDRLEAAQQQRDSLRTAARKSAIDSISTASNVEELNTAWKRINQNWTTFADTPESISSLRSLILDLAIRGKLVPQRVGEKTISVESVDGRHELPDSWKWVKISTVSDFVNGFAFRSEEYIEDGIGIVRMSDLKLGQIATQGMKRVPSKYLTILDVNLRVSPGDLVIGMSGSIGKPCFNSTDETFLLNQRVGKFVPHSVDQKYLAIVLHTLENSFLEMSAGSGIKNLSTKQIKDAELPLPPQSEQERIVAKVNDLMDLCNQLENALLERDELKKSLAGSLANDAVA